MHHLVHPKAFVEMGTPSEDRRDLARGGRGDPERAAVTDDGRLAQPGSSASSQLPKLAKIIGGG